MTAIYTPDDRAFELWFASLQHPELAPLIRLLNCNITTASALLPYYREHATADYYYTHYPEAFV